MRRFRLPSFRIALIVLSVLVLVLAGLPYLGMQYRELGPGALADRRPRRCQTRGGGSVADPGDPAPYVTQASIYTSAARKALATSGQDRAGAVLDDLAFAIGAYEKAIARDPADWANHYMAALGRLGSRACPGLRGRQRGRARGRRRHPAARRTARLVGPGRQRDCPAPGARRLTGAGRRCPETAARYRDLTRSQLLALASGFMSAAKERNPLEPAVDEAIQLIEKLPKE